ncbi:PD-(D/E)XK nuclease family protein [Haloarculaceae archaeon H-GB11]|nr:PD-(D/E)XK nuclease family protein [Haloarculaceae archaeon H-GB11]
MLHNLADVNDDIARFEGKEITVRCKIIGDSHRGDRGGEKVLFEADDPTGNLDVQTLVSFWLDEPSGEMFGDIRRTEQYVLNSLSEGKDPTPALPRGETLLVRGIPKVTNPSGGRRLYINVTSAVIRAPDLQIGKNEIRTQESCPRRYYLRYVKKVYNGSSSLNQYAFRGDAIHLALEYGIEDEREKFVENAWNEPEATAFVNDIMDEEMGIRQAKLSIAGIGLGVKTDIEEIVARLFTDERFCEHIASGATVEAERPLSENYGYNGTVDLVIDGVPYDLKTTWKLTPDKKAKYGRQLRLYLFALLLEGLEPGENLVEALSTDEHIGYLVYPNLEESDNVRIERVELTVDDIADLVAARNEVAASRSSFSPPSPYNRECDGCHYRNEQTVSGGDDTLPPACTFHCQNERRWPCYEFNAEQGVTSDCSLFEECEQRLEYRDTDETDHYNALRSALQSERQARTTANDLMESVDEEALIRSGRLVTGLKVAGGNNLGLLYETEEEAVPAFTPGDIVRLEPVVDGEPGKDVPYLGRDGDTYVFGFEELDPSFMDSDITYRVWCGFDPEIVKRRYLPYLDYAERRESNPRFEYRETKDRDGTIDIGSTSDVAEYLDAEEVFVNLPARTDRQPVLAGLIGALTSAEYPHPDTNEAGADAVVPNEGRRALVLCQTPEQVETAHEATFGDHHYRMDGFASGENTIYRGLDRQEIQDRLLNSRSLVSTVQYALSSKHFHELEEGGFGNRDHSENFFDVVVLVGAERLTEPVYLYLRDVADRVVSIGDRHSHGPEMVSTEARDRGLNRSYFEWAHDRYGTVPVEEAVSLRFAGHGNRFIRDVFDDEPIEEIDSTLSFFGIEGTEATGTEDITLRAAVRARSGIGQDLEFDVTHTSANPFEVQKAFVEREYLDATNLPGSGSVLIDDFPLQLTGKRLIDEVENPTFHRVTIKADPDAIPAFAQAFLYNRPEATIVAQLADDYDPDIVVTPFEAHANELSKQLRSKGLDIPVRLPRTLDGTVADRAIVSFAAANSAGILHPPLTEPDTLYSLLTCAEDILLVGDEDTLRSKDAIERLVSELSEPYELTG